MRASATTELPAATDADTVVVGLIEGESIKHDTQDGALAALVESGEAKPRPGHLAVTHADGRRWVLAGLGKREDLDDERLRTAAAGVVGRARELGTEVLCWELPHKLAEGLHPARAVVEGTFLAARRFTAYKGSDDEPEDRLRELVVSDHEDRAEAVARAVVVAEAINAARDLQEAPANHLTPTDLARAAQDVASRHAAVACEVEGRDGIVGRGMGAFAAVARGSDEEPALITLRYEPEGAPGPLLAYVGKGVTFDSGGYSIKPAASMADMKMDMSGAAAVLHALDAIATLGVRVRLLVVIGAVENLVNGRAVKPGDVITTAQGLTVQIDNTDAEGRLVLADCLWHAREQGAERLVDVATLTGAVVVALGSTYSGMVATDDAWAAEVLDAGAEAGELIWRLPLHQDYSDAVKGRTADLTNSPEQRKAGTITGGAFLQRFAGDVPWVHLDIAG